MTAQQLAPRLLSWASILDEKAREQAITTSGMPFVHPHVALMPGAHLGKGATVGSVIPTLGAIIPAAVGVAPGLILGSMGTASYVVVGKGNRESLNSSPHGAGRNRSRSAARRLFTRAQLRDAMKGIEYRDTDAFIDEIPAAYKDIDQVMSDAADLVEVRHTLRQIVNVKGD
ncbi:RtcB family protein [Isoptericola variabilis]|nr:RtcB family protein [Isoptericola variabilis]